MPGWDKKLSRQGAKDIRIRCDRMIPQEVELLRLKKAGQAISVKSYSFTF